MSRKEFLENLLTISQTPVFKELLKEIEEERADRIGKILTEDLKNPHYDREIARHRGVIQGLDAIPALLQEAKQELQKEAK